MKCKNCGNWVAGKYTERGIKMYGKQEYSHVCYMTHSLFSARPNIGHVADRECYPGMCDNPEPREGEE